RVGELARRTGVSVRTLHYYDEIGLLSPSRHSAVGHRLYGVDEISRLQQIKSLRQLGFSLDEIQGCLQRPGFSPERLLQQHIARLRAQIALQQGLCTRLEALANGLRTREDVSFEALVQTIQEMSRVETYYTPEQRDQLKERAQAVGTERIHQV